MHPTKTILTRATDRAGQRVFFRSTHQVSTAGCRRWGIVRHYILTHDQVRATQEKVFLQTRGLYKQPVLYRRNNWANTTCATVDPTTGHCVDYVPLLNFMLNQRQLASTNNGSAVPSRKLCPRTLTNVTLLATSCLSTNTN